jgi:hypothetical protein
MTGMGQSNLLTKLNFLTIFAEGFLFLLSQNLAYKQEGAPNLS